MVINHVHPQNHVNSGMYFLSILCRFESATGFLFQLVGKSEKMMPANVLYKSYRKTERFR